MSVKTTGVHAATAKCTRCWKVIFADLEEEKERVRVQKIRDVMLKKREEIELIKERVALYEAKRHLLD